MVRRQEQIASAEQSTQELRTTVMATCRSGRGPTEAQSRGGDLAGEAAATGMERRGGGGLAMDACGDLAGIRAAAGKWSRTRTATSSWRWTEQDASIG